MATCRRARQFETTRSIGRLVPGPRTIGPESEAKPVNDTMTTNAGQASAATGETVGVVDIADILRALPHRYPFVMIDRVQDMRGDAFGIGIKNVTFNEPQFT